MRDKLLIPSLVARHHTGNPVPVRFRMSSIGIKNVSASPRIFTLKVKSCRPAQKAVTAGSPNTSCPRRGRREEADYARGSDSAA